MTETLSVLEPMQLPRTRSSRTTSPQLRKEVHNMLRDVAFVLAQTRRVHEQIIEEQQLSNGLGDNVIQSAVNAHGS